MRKIAAFEWISLDGVFNANPEYFRKWYSRVIVKHAQRASGRPLKVKMLSGQPLE